MFNCQNAFDAIGRVGTLAASAPSVPHLHRLTANGPMRRDARCDADLETRRRTTRLANSETGGASSAEPSSRDADCRTTTRRAAPSGSLPLEVAPPESAEIRGSGASPPRPDKVYATSRCWLGRCAYWLEPFFVLAVAAALTVVALAVGAANLPNTTSLTRLHGQILLLATE